MNVMLAAAALMLAGSVGAPGTAAPPPPSPPPSTPLGQPATATLRPAGWSDRSYYLAMPDGVRVAVSLWFPGGRAEGKHPVLLVQTRYGRAGTFIHGEGGKYRALVDQGFVVAIVDTRGSTASFGDRMVEIGPDEIRDMDTIITHLKTRPWSNGQVFAQGVSYMADTADLATGSRAGLTGAVIRASDFDAYLHLFAPGGIANEMMMRLWGGDTLLRDYGKSLDPREGFDCGARVADCARLWPRIQPVDEDSDHALLRKAFAARRHWTPDDYRRAEFRDDKGANGFTMFASSPAARLADIARRRVPVQYWASWMDAGTAEGTLARYRSLPGVPMEVWITANNHVGNRLTDPFLPDAPAPLPAFEDQWAKIAAFIATVRAGRPVTRAIHYYVLGAGRFRTTAEWPPADTTRTRFRLGAAGSLSSGRAGPDGADRYDVDFSATTGAATRWTTQIGAPAAYGDRRDADRKLLTYSSEPFAQDMELVGTPSVTLFVATATADPAFFAYLEDVAPDGRVTYLTEGLFRAVHRKPARADRLPYAQPEPAKSFARADARPMPPGTVAEVSFPAFPVAARIRAGHRLRLSLAGADAGTFRRYSEGKAESWRVQRGARYPSSLSVDLRPWRD
ncbi:CocE/NonD family hydrolase [Sphingomonas colocasiae]|uniref:CocE/NonD family hydrolase n=1 Tax=Sphingomonas colocasiae TaxID=1848973 RepID=A0ABS7PLP9_9SPHN|nr:CocE/NonD family hydrolase [Sphingomonas colocasiae]MBY8822232.1 CocE/NonD family hydrolase [Sphingomonas colocasiae]